MPVFFVRRKSHSVPSTGDIPTADEQYCTTFTDRAAAEERARRLDWQEKRSRKPATFDPFGSWRWEDVSTLPPAILRDWLRDEGIEPPVEPESFPEGKRPGEIWLWYEWWQKLVKVRKKKPTPVQWERIWLGLDRFRVFEVVEGESEPTPAGVAVTPTVVYVVVERSWYFNDDGFGGNNYAQQAYRTREAAEQARDEAERGLRPIDPEGDPTVLREFVVIELPLDQVAEG